MELIDNIPAAAAEVKATLAAYDPTAYFVVGETNMSQTANEWNEQPVGALFAAANALEWLSFGAQSVDWWDVHNYGTPTADFGMFSSGTTGQPAVNTPYAPYYGHLLASKLAVKGAKVGTLPVATPNIYGYYANLPGGVVRGDAGQRRPDQRVLAQHLEPRHHQHHRTRSTSTTRPTRRSPRARCPARR